MRLVRLKKKTMQCLYYYQTKHLHITCSIRTIVFQKKYAHVFYLTIFTLKGELSMEWNGD